MPLRNTFRDTPIRQKLIVVIMATTAAAMILACAGILAFDTYLFRTSLERDLNALTRIIGENITASLAFNDPRSASETLNSLRERPHLVAACIFRSDGTSLATYFRTGAKRVCPPSDKRDELRFNGDGATISYGVVQGSQRYGTLMLLYDLEEISQRRQLFGTIVIGVLLVSGLIAFLLSSGLRALIADPISQLVRATTAVSETNDYSIRAHKTSGDELGVLVDRFNEMLAGIQSRDDNLTKAHERFRFLAESMPQKIFTATPAGEPNYFNRQWSEFTGLSFQKLQQGAWMSVVHPDDIEAGMRVWNQSLKTGEPIQIQQRLLRADGTYRWHLVRVHAMHGGQNAISMWIGSVTDIHEQKVTEEELRRANEDLQQFAFSASHDLQEPVRNVTVYSELIARRYHDLLDADGRKFLGFLTEGGRRLSMLISDLLAYTRAGAIEADNTVQDASAVLEHTLSTLSATILENNATVTFDPLPEVCMTEAHLQQLFQNLIGNALKYRTEEPPRVHISAEKIGATWRFAVQDNGIGIDPQYKEKIFGVFKRLHRDQKYDGTGIGLAICQRVVERYGGRIWVESAPGKGATFYFTVPHFTDRVPPAAAERSVG